MRPAQTRAAPPLSLAWACATAGALGVLTWLLHGSALDGGWRLDDPPHLQFVARHAPWEYFSVRAVMLQQSYAHITPWNALFYELGLPWFGLDPRGHYAHMLVVLWATALATGLLLRRWLSAGVAAMAAALFLALPPTASVAQQLMTGHYAWGLLFSVLALHFHSVALEQAPAPTGRPPKAAFAAAGCYALACLCKELYVPLVAFALLMPAASRRLWWSSALPWLAVALAYTVLRLHVLGGIGGYAALQSGDAPSLPGWLDTSRAALAGLWREGLGPGLPGAAALGLVISIVAVGVACGRRPRLHLVLVAALLMLAPIWSQFRIGQPGGHVRLLLLVGWATAVLCAWQLEGWWQRGWRWQAAAAFGTLLLAAGLGQVPTRALIQTGQVVAQAQNGALSRGEAPLLVPEGFDQQSYLASMADAAQRLEGRPLPVIVEEEDAFLALGPVRGPQAHAWDPGCACVAPLAERYETRAQSIRSALQAGQSLGIETRLALSGEGRLRRFAWQIQGAPGQVFVHVEGYARFTLPARGVIDFGLDNTAQLADPVRLRVLVQTPAGALVRTPWLELPRDRRAEVRWPAAAP
jgi:hypothetical protein